MIPSASRRRRRRAARSSSPSVAPASGAGAPVMVGARSAQVGLPAGAVADDEQGVLLERVAGRVEETRAALGGALPDPPALVLVERRGLGGELAGQVLLRRDERRDRGGTGRLGLARVRVVLADVRGHRSPPGLGMRDRRLGSCERSQATGRRTIAK